MQVRGLALRLLKHDFNANASTKRALSDIAAQAPRPFNEQQYSSIETKSANTVKREWIRFSSTKNQVLDSRPSAALPIDVGSLILFEDNHLLVLLKPNMTLVQGDLGRASNLLDSAKEFLVKRDKKRGEAFLGTRDEIKDKWYLNSQAMQSVI